MKGKRARLAAVMAGLLFGASGSAAEAAASVITFDPPNASGWIDYVGAINQEGTVVGDYVDASGNGHGFVRTSDGTFTTIDGPHSKYTSIEGINDEGTFVGSFTKPDGQSSFCFVEKADGQMRPFSIQKSPLCGAMSINKSGMITGVYGNGGFIWDKGMVTTFEVSDAGASTYPMQINDAGVVTGYYFGSGRYVGGFVRAANGTVTTFDAPGAVYTSPTSINSAGEIAGWYNTAKSSQRAFIRATDGTFTTFRYGKAALASAINKRGQVAGFHMNKHGANVGYIRSSDGSTFRHFQAGVSTFLDAMNNDGTTAGTYEDSNSVYHGFVRTR